MTLDHIYCPAAILKLRGMSLREKLLLSLAFKFNDKGLRASNAELAELLDILPSRVSDLLNGLERKECIEIRNRQSRHRAIYFRPKSKVGQLLLSTELESKDVLLSTLGHSTFDGNRNKRKKEYRRAHKTTKAQDKNDRGFERFWSGYPKKVGKGDAMKAWAKINPDDALIARILEGLDAYRETEEWMYPREGGRFIPHAATWLNGRRWEDEVQPCFNDPTDEEIDEINSRHHRGNNDVGDD